MDIVNVIDRLDALLNTSRKMPATRSRIVDADKVMELVEQLRLAIPQDVRAAQEVIEKRTPSSIRPRSTAGTLEAMLRKNTEPG